MSGLGLTHYLLLSTCLFGIGLLGVIVRRNAVAMLMCVEIMLNAVNINFVAISKFVVPATGNGEIFALFVMVVAAAEVAVGMGLIVNIYQQRKSVDLDRFNLLKW